MTISEHTRDRVRGQAGNRCGYCLSSQAYVMGLLEIEHIVPTAAGGADDEENLWLACRLCNGYKGTQQYGHDPETNEQISLFNPRRQSWHEHFMWSEDATQIIGITACGRATVTALQLNNPIATTVRQNWVKAGWHPPEV